LRPELRLCAVADRGGYAHALDAELARGDED
jgi:hypothetical protein